jgi:hypothetical protein
VLGPYSGLEYPFCVRVMDPDLRSYLDDALAPLRGGPGGQTYSFVDHGSASRRRYSIYLDGLRVVRTPAPSVALSYLLWHINRRAVRVSERYLLIHASSASRDGRAVVLPAPSGSGKTTLVAALVRRGLAYITDEATAIDPATGSLHPYPKPLALGPASPAGDLLTSVPPGVRAFLESERHVGPAALGGEAEDGAARPTVIVSPRYVAGAPTVIEAISRAQTVLLLAQNAFNLEGHGGEGLEVLGRIARGSNGYTLVSGSLEEACDAVVTLLG